MFLIGAQSRIGVTADDRVKIETREVTGMGVSDPEVRKKLFGPRWLQLQHESEKQRWPRWKRLIHRLQRCPICKPSKKKEQ